MEGCAAFGNLFGGFAGDWAVKRNPDKGRIYLALISIFSGIPLTYVLFNFVPRDIESQGSLIAVGMFMGFMISWVA